MKRKNIFKIGVLSIVLLSLLISPLLIFNKLEANAFGTFLGLFGEGTSETGLSFNEYLNFCSSEAASNLVTSSPITYQDICCNSKDIEYNKVQSSISYPSILNNCKIAQNNIQNQAIPVFDEGWCHDSMQFGNLSLVINATTYIETCCKTEDPKTQYVSDRCQAAYDTIHKYLQAEVVQEQEVNILDCVHPKYDENNEEFTILYFNPELYLEKCCQFNDEEKQILSQAQKNLLDYRCETALEDNYVSIGPGDIQDALQPIEPSGISSIGYWGTGGTIDQFKGAVQEESAVEICGGELDESIAIWQHGWIEYQLCVLQKGIVEGTGKLVSGLMNSLISLILWAFNPATYGGFVENSSVINIWGTLRDFMNLTLVLILVFIAIATILGIKKYRWQETLWKLIIVALLINFSLIIPGIILDTSHFVAFTFLNSAKLDNDNIATSMMKTYRTEEISGEEKYKLTLVDDATQDSIKGWQYSWGNFFLTMAAIIILGLFAIISLLAIFVTMIFRSAFIIILLCLAPIAFAAWILPSTAKYWQLWWNQFIKWCTFPVVFALMLYIGLFILNSVNQVDLSQAGDKANIVAMFIQIILFSMFLVGGLIFSIQSGGAIAQGVQKQGNKLALGAGALLGTRALKGVTSSSTWKKTQEKLEKSKITPIHDLGVGMGEMPEKIRATELKRFEDYYKHASDDHIRRDVQAHKRDKARVAIGLNQLIERKKIDYKDLGLINIARDQSSLKVSGIKKASPELYVEHFTKPEDMKNTMERVKANYPGIPEEKAKDRAITELLTEQVLKSSADNIKDGNWENVFKKLTEKEESNKFFENLLKKNLPASKLAAMINSIDDTNKQKDFVEGVINSIMEFNVGSTRSDALDYLRSNPQYRRNPVIRGAFNL
jgi:hypothetical protein